MKDILHPRSIQASRAFLRSSYLLSLVSDPPHSSHATLTVLSQGPILSSFFPLPRETGAVCLAPQRARELQSLSRFPTSRPALSPATSRQGPVIGYLVARPFVSDISFLEARKCSHLSAFSVQNTINVGRSSRKFRPQCEEVCGGQQT